ncbi:MAG: TraR/DksA family transcriptional regulator [Planctomycetia bacterium]|nr:TraR/DksA family transcriptional regulator [Planctomycetia bacterium]
MSSDEFSDYKERLLMLQARLRGDMSQLEDLTIRKNRAESGELSTQPSHMADCGSDNHEQEIALQMIGSAAEILENIAAALERIEEGKYNICEICGVKIPKKRLQAIPYTTMCVKCAEKEYD